MAISHPGFRFRPTDEQLFVHYLLRRLNREPLPDPNAVHDRDVYGGGDPWEIFGKDRHEKFYVFTMLKKKNKSRVDRTAGSGTWKGEQSYEIRDSRGELVGYKKLFAFKPKSSPSAQADKAENGHWIMYEYSTHSHNETDPVLCVISNKCAKKVNEKVCRSLHGGVQLEEEDRRAKKARPLCYDHTNAIDVPSTASPPSTAAAAAAAQAQPSASRAFNGDEGVIPRDDIRYAADSQALRSSGNTNSLPPAAANTQEDTRPTASLAFGGTNAGPLSTTSTATPMVDCDWANRLMNMELSPSVQYFFYQIVKQRARALHARNDLVESHSGGVPTNWPH